METNSGCCSSEGRHLLLPIVAHRQRISLPCASLSLSLPLTHPNLKLDNNLKYGFDCKYGNLIAGFRPGEHVPASLLNQAQGVDIAEVSIASRLTVEEIAQVIEDYRLAARNAINAGINLQILCPLILVILEHFNHFCRVRWRGNSRRLWHDRPVLEGSGQLPNRRVRRKLRKSQSFRFTSN